jgi:hypothetical protein
MKNWLEGNEKVVCNVPFSRFYMHFEKFLYPKKREEREIKFSVTNLLSVAHQNFYPDTTLTGFKNFQSHSRTVFLQLTPSSTISHSNHTLETCIISMIFTFHFITSTLHHVISHIVDERDERNNFLTRPFEVFFVAANLEEQKKFAAFKVRNLRLILMVLKEYTHTVFSFKNFVLNLNILCPS